MSTNDFDITLSPETVQEITNAADRNLTAPTVEDNHTFKQGKEAGLGSWQEVVRVRDTSIVATKNAPGDKNKMNLVLILEILGPSEGGFKTNANRVHNHYAFIDLAGLSDADPKTSGVFKRRLAVVNSSLSACGVDVASGISSYRAYLENDKPLVGQKLVAMIRKYRNKNTGDTGIDIDGFSPAA